MELKKTVDYFDMSIEELLEIRNENNYTREECKILDESLKAFFFDSLEEYQDEKLHFEQWVKDQYPKLKLKAILITINERIAVLYE